MRHTLNRTVHPLACSCHRCAPRAVSRRRLRIAIKTAIRVSLVIGTIIAIPFVIAWSLANANGGNR